MSRNGFRIDVGSVRIRIMTHISGPDRSQTLLLPESLDEYVGQDNPVRFIDALR